MGGWGENEYHKVAQKISSILKIMFKLTFSAMAQIRAKSYHKFNSIKADK